MRDTPEISGAKRKLELQATELPNWARQLLDYIALLEREVAALRSALQRTLSWLTSYPGGGTMLPGGPYEQARAALGDPCISDVQETVERDARRWRVFWAMHSVIDQNHFGDDPKRALALVTAIPQGFDWVKGSAEAFDALAGMLERGEWRPDMLGAGTEVIKAADVPARSNGHVCGLAGFDQMRDGPCPACQPGGGESYSIVEVEKMSDAYVVNVNRFLREMLDDLEEGSTDPTWPAKIRTILERGSALEPVPLGSQARGGAVKPGGTTP